MRIYCIIIVFCILAAPSWAAPIKTRYTTVELISENATVPETGGTITLGFYLNPNPSWHVYWKNSGDAGREPTVNWRAPNGVEISDFQFPVPTVLPFGELNTYGYKDSILLLADVSIPANLPNTKPLRIQGTASWVVCDDQTCVPDRANISIKLEHGDGGISTDQIEKFTSARAAIPPDVEWPANYSVSDGKVSFKISPVDLRTGFEDAYLFVESKEFVQYGSQTVKVDQQGISIVMDAALNANKTSGTDAVLTYTQSNGTQAAVGLSILKVSPAVLPPRSNLSFVKAALFAFLGGIILNLMPCVFPILSMKALSLVQLTEQNRRTAHESGIIYTIGILIAFVIVASILLGLRAAGDAVGWGFQMQNPFFVVVLGLLMVAIGVNLLGAFEVGTRVMGVGQELTVGGERREAFFTGLLAVVVATPCMAPFMAAALGYALIQPATIAIIVFLMLGLGLAFPYLLLSFVPALGRIMPKPGIWMETFKQILAFPMFVTALWLFWIVGQQLGATSMFIGLLSALAVAFALWAYGKGAISSHKRRRWNVTAIIVAAVAIFASLQVEPNKVQLGGMGGSSVHKLGELELENFNASLVKTYIAEGQPTFVYFTADWCISCKANERVALATDKVAEAFNSRGIKVIEGDWTSEDPIITAWLAMYDRVGVPLYLYFPKGSSLETVTILPQILTPGIVVDAIITADKQAQFN